MFCEGDCSKRLPLEEGRRRRKMGGEREMRREERKEREVRGKEGKGIWWSVLIREWCLAHV